VSPRPLRPLPLAALAAACAAGLALVYALLVRTYAGQRIDEAALNGRLGSPAARRAAGELLTTIGVGSLVLVLALIAGQALVRRRAALALAAVGLVAGALLTTEVLKHLVLARPDLLPRPSALDHNSFPSGHTTIAFAAGLAATLAAPPRWRRPVAVGALLYGTAIGVATVAAGWHRPSDVAGALLVVTGWAAVIALAVAAADPDAFRDEVGEDAASGTAASTWARAADLEGYALVAVGAVVLGWAVAVAIVAGRHAGAIELTALNAAFVAACASIAALATVLTAALLLALREALPRGGGVAAAAAPLRRP